MKNTVIIVILSIIGLFIFAANVKIAIDRHIKIATLETKIALMEAQHKDCSVSKFLEN